MKNGNGNGRVKKDPKQSAVLVPEGARKERETVDMPKDHQKLILQTMAEQRELKERHSDAVLQQAAATARANEFATAISQKGQLIEEHIKSMATMLGINLNEAGCRFNFNLPGGKIVIEREQAAVPVVPAPPGAEAQ